MSMAEVFTEVSQITTDLFGAIYTFTRETYSDNPVTLEIDTTPDDTQTYTAKCTNRDYNLREIDGEVIKFGDVAFYMSLPVTITPRIGDTTSFNGATWRIQSIQPYITNDTITSYKLNMRR